MPSSLRLYVSTLFRETLFRNSFYLILATAVVACFGFLFWFINARLFSITDVGLATTLIAVMNLIALLSLVGFDAVFVRFLPTSGNKSEALDTGFVLVASVALALGALFVVFTGVLSPHLVFIRANILYALIFIAACVMNALNVLTDAVFIAHRRADYTLTVNIVSNGIKLLLPFLFVPFGAIGIFLAAALAQMLGSALSMALIVDRFGYTPRARIHAHVVSLVWRYSGSSYGAVVIGLLPVTILPIIITNYLGPAAAAYYYIVMMIGNLLYTIPWAATRSLFAEGSHAEQAIGEHMRKLMPMLAMSLLSSMLFLLFFGNDILRLFGKEYAAGGNVFLRLVALSGIPVATYALYGALFRVRKDLTAPLIGSVAYTISIVALAYALLPAGLPGIGVAWLTGNSIAALVSCALYARKTEATLPLHEKLAELRYRAYVILSAKMHYVISRFRGGQRFTILFYPEKPRFFHILYSICHKLGYRMTNDPAACADLVYFFEDATVRRRDAASLPAKARTVNAECADIGKERVERVFREVFGYGMTVDPRSHKGVCVKKSNVNAAHDGKVVTCPVEPEPGYVYQKLIDNRRGDMTVDIRGIIFGKSIPFVLLRYKSIDDRFDHTLYATMENTREHLSDAECVKILQFCEAFGLECGELDILRDASDGKLYIVDANNTSAGPWPWRHMSLGTYHLYLDRMSGAFAAFATRMREF